MLKNKRFWLFFFALFSLKTIAICSQKIAHSSLINQIHESIQLVSSNLGHSGAIKKATVELLLQRVSEKKLNLYNRYLLASLEAKENLPNGLRALSPHLDYFYSQSIRWATEHLDTQPKAARYPALKETLKETLKNLSTTKTFSYLSYLKTLFLTLVICSNDHIPNEEFENAFPKWVTDWDLPIPEKQGATFEEFFYLRIRSEHLGLFPIFIHEDLSENDLTFFQLTPFTYPIGAFSAEVSAHEGRVSGFLSFAHHDLTHVTMRFVTDHLLHLLLGFSTQGTTINMAQLATRVGEERAHLKKNDQEVHGNIIFLLNQWAREPDDTRPSVLQALHLLLHESRMGFTQNSITHFLKDCWTSPDALHSHLKEKIIAPIAFSEGSDENKKALEKSKYFLFKNLSSLLRRPKK